MIGQLLNNFTLLISFLFFGNLMRTKIISTKLIEERLQHGLEGTLLGLFGIMLLHYSFPITSSVFMDFRQIPILVSVYLGGWLSGLCTTLILTTYRMFLLNGFSFESIMGGLNIALTYIAACYMIRRGHLQIKAWIHALGSCLVITSVILLFSVGPEYFWPNIKFCIGLLIGGLLTYFMMNYLKRSENLLQTMQEEARSDFLTGLHNSRAFESMFRQIKEQNSHRKIPYSLMVIDIDHFKKVNDTYGHPAGDAVLTQLADVLRESFRAGDLIARKGGEEFVVVVDYCGAEKIGMVAEKVRANVERHPFLLPDGTELRISISVGAASYPEVQSNHLFDQADQALYRAKELGRNRVCIAMDLFCYIPK